MKRIWKRGKIEVWFNGVDFDIIRREAVVSDTKQHVDGCSRLTTVKKEATAVATAHNISKWAPPKKFARWEGSKSEAAAYASQREDGFIHVSLRSSSDADLERTIKWLMKAQQYREKLKTLRGRKK